MNNIRENIKKYYDQEAALRNSKSLRADWKINVRENFFNIIKKENKTTLLELGPGAGYDSQFFMNNGLKVSAVDISGEMVKICLEKGIEAYELDFYNLSSLRKKFDCIYALNTLLHIPKADLSFILSEINEVLDENGLFYMGLYGGQDTENEFVKSDVSDFPRFFALHSDTYLKSVLGSCFHILDFQTIDIKTGTQPDIFHSIIMRKKVSLV